MTTGRGRALTGPPGLGNNGVVTDAGELIVSDAVAWRGWLLAHGGDSIGVWLVLAKKDRVAPTSLTYDDALDEALCFGWIDGQARARDEVSHIRRFTPRRARSPWSQRNVGIIRRLITAGRMQPGGIAEVERAQADGRWAVAYEGSATIGVPPDLQVALDAKPAAQAMFDILSSQNRYAVLHRITTVKRAETRARRIEQFVDALAKGETVYPQRRTLDP